MSERPMLFSGPMVRAIIEGRKTQTRRVMKPQPVHGGPLRSGWHWSCRSVNYPIDRRLSSARVLAGVCPYGAPGDRLWVREAWAALINPSTLRARGAPEQSDHISYRADGEWMGNNFSWRPSIHMPRWASRLTLEVTGVRVERLQDISEEDAKAEGVAQSSSGYWLGADRVAKGALVMAAACPTPRGAFASLWESINRAGSWDANPWVWRVEFRRVDPK